MLWGPNTTWRFRADLRLLLAGFLFLFSLRDAIAGNYQVRLISPSLVETAPGKIVTAGLLVSNDTDHDQQLTEALALPPGWQQVAPTDPFFIVKANSQQVRVVALFVPAASPAGRFEVGYSMHGQRNLALADSVGFTVAVQTVYKTELLVDEQPPVVLAGESYDVLLRVMNRGNKRAVLRLQVESMPDYPVTYEHASLELAPGASQSVRLTVSTDGANHKRILHVLTIKAVTESGAVVASKSAVVEVLPQVTGDSDPYYRLPTRLSFTAVKDSGKSAAFQTQYSGGGNLDEDGDRKLYFLARSPNTQHDSVFGTPDEFWVNYLDKSFDAYLGDRSYALSPLTERNSYGRGVELDAHHGPTGFGAFYMDSRLQPSDFSEVGAHVQQQFTPWFGLKANMLHRDGSDRTALTNGVSQDLVSLESHLVFGKAVDINLEGGGGEEDHYHQGNNFGYRAQASGELARDIFYSLEKVYAGPRFFGYYNDSDFAQGSVTFPIYARLRGNFNFQDYANNLDRNPARGPVATRETTYRPGLRYALFRDTELLLDYTNLRRQDVMLPADYDFTEHSAKLGVGQNIGRLSAQVYAERGTLYDYLIHHEHLIERYSTFLFFRATPKQTYSLFASTGQGLLTASPGRSQSFGGSAQWIVGRGLRMNVQLSRNVTETDTGRHIDSIYSTVAYTSSRGNELALTARVAKHNDPDQTEESVMVTYSIPFGLPVGRRTGVGVLKGRVHDVEDPSAAPVSRAVLTAGDATAVTDRNGEFVFPSLKPGRHLVRIQQESIGFDRVTTQVFPVLVEVRKGETTVVDIGVVRAASLSAKVVVYGASTGNITTDDKDTAKDSFTEVAGLEGALTEISNGTETFRRTTDNSGSVSFDHIRPGRWTVKVYGDNLPPHHYLEAPESVLEVSPGGKQLATIRILPRHRPVQFIDSGSVRTQ